MKRLFGIVLLCGFLTVSMAQAAKTVKHPKVHQSKLARKQAKRAGKNAKGRKVAKVRKAARSKRVV